MSKLKISPDLALPADTVTSTMVVYGGKGMGKTNYSAVLAEELQRAGHRFSFLDPVGVAYGLQYSVDGKGPGLEVLVLGGKHGDIPIEATGGAVVADLVADENVDVVIDISRRQNGEMWTVAERIRFVTEYCLRLYQRQGERRRPLMQIIDEAGRYVPQQIPHGSPEIAKCVGAIEQLVELGRNVAVGVCLNTQRSARMNKSVSELADCMIAFRTVGPRSVDAVLDWLGEHVEKARWKTLTEQLRSLPVGQALVVSPGWLEFEGVVRMRARQTFDSSKTPTGKGERRASGKARKPDLAKYRERMAETIERVKADDPKALRAKIAILERERVSSAGVLPGLAVKPKVKVERVEVPMFTTRERKALGRVEVDLSKIRRGVEQLSKSLVFASASLSSTLGLARELPKAGDARAIETWPDPPQIVKSHTLLQHAQKPTPKISSKGSPSSSNGASEVPGGGMQRMLVALAQRPGGLTSRQLGVRAGLAWKGGTFTKYLSKLRTSGWAEGRGTVRVTPHGLEALGYFDPLPEGAALVEYWKRELGGGAARMLACLVKAYPNALNKERLGELAEISEDGGTFSKYMSRLRSLQLVTGRGEYRASDEFFS